MTVRTTRRYAQVLAAVAAIAIFAAGCGDDDDSDTSTAASAPPVSLEGRVNDHGSTDLGSATTLDLELDDTYFAPTYIAAEPGSTITVTLENEGDAPHTFTIDGTTVDEEMAAAGKVAVQIGGRDLLEGAEVSVEVSCG